MHFSRPRRRYLAIRSRPCRRRPRHGLFLHRQQGPYRQTGMPDSGRQQRVRPVRPARRLSLQWRRSGEGVPGSRHLHRQPVAGSPIVRYARIIAQARPRPGLEDRRLVPAGPLERRRHSRAGIQRPRSRRFRSVADPGNLAPDWRRQGRRAVPARYESVAGSSDAAAEFRHRPRSESAAAVLPAHSRRSGALAETDGSERLQTVCVADERLPAQLPGNRPFRRLRPAGYSTARLGILPQHRDQQGADRPSSRTGSCRSPPTARNQTRPSSGPTPVLSATAPAN